MNRQSRLTIKDGDLTLNSKGVRHITIRVNRNTHSKPRIRVVRAKDIKYKLDSELIGRNNKDDITVKMYSRSQCSNHINTLKEDLVFQLIDSMEEDIEKFDENSSSSGGDQDENVYKKEQVPDPCEYQIKLFGVTKDGVSVGAIVNGFPPHFYIKVPNDWRQSELNAFMRFIKNKYYCITKDGVQNFHTYGDSLLKYDIIERKTIYGFTNDRQFEFIRLVFKNMRAMKKCSYFLSKGLSNVHGIFNSTYKTVPLEIYEANITPLLRFFHIQNLVPGGWVKLPANKYWYNELPITRCTLDVKCDWFDAKYYDNNDIAPLRQASFDIECYSVDGSLPTPDVDGNVISQIATTFQDGCDSDTFMKHIVCLKYCEPIEGVIVECYETEADLLLAWAKIIREMDPDILYGYNIFWFDLHYIIIRAEMLGIYEKFAELGKIRHKLSVLEEKTLESKAYGHNDYRMVHMSGRLQIDLLPVIKKEKKFRSYKLDHVSEKILGDKKEDVDVEKIFSYFKSGDPELIKKLAIYCVKDTLLPQRIVNKLCMLTNLIEMARVTCVPISYLVTRGQQIKVFSQLARAAREAGYLIPTFYRNYDDEESGKSDDGYEGATVLKAKKGAYYEPVVGLDFKSLYPTIMIDHNFCYTTLVIDQQYDNIPGIDYKVIEINGTKYKFVQNRQGLLPKILIELLDARGVAKKDMYNAKTPMKKKVANGRQLALKISCNSVYGFTGVHKGILPCVAIAQSVTFIGRGMIDESKKYAENYDNFPELHNYKHACENESVVIQDYGCSVVYGDTDSIFCKFDVSKFEKKPKFERIKYCIVIGKVVADKITKRLIELNETSRVFVKWTELEYEKIYDPLFLFSKKRYAGKMYELNPKESSYIDKKGIVMTRRDNCLYVVDVYGGCVNILMDDESNLDSNGSVKSNTKELLISRATKFATGLIDDLLADRIPIEKLIISKSINNSYKSRKLDRRVYIKTILDLEVDESEFVDISAPQVRLARKLGFRDPGNKPTSGTRLPYVFVVNKDLKKIGFGDGDLIKRREVMKYHGVIKASSDGKKLLQWQKAEDPKYVLKNGLRLDYMYYLANQLQKPLLSLFEILTDNPYDLLFKELVRKYTNELNGQSEITSFFAI